MELKGFESLGFDKIYILNLPQRTDRKDLIIHELQLNGITEYEFFDDMVDGKTLKLKTLLNKKLIDPIQVESGGTITLGVFGCALSHYNTWVKLINSEYDNALILEDDIYIGDPDLRNALNLWNIISKELTTINDWDIFFLSRLFSSTKNVGESVTDNIIKPVSAWTLPDPKPWGAHAYVITKKAAQFLVDNYIPIWTPVDVYLDMFALTKELNVYSMLNNFILQRNQWIVYNQLKISKEALDNSPFGEYNDSNIVSNDPSIEEMGFSSLRPTYKNLEAVATINMNEKIITFITKKSFNDFMKKAKSTNDVQALYRGMKLEHE